MREVNIDPNATAREILAALDKWAITANYNEVQHMWNILTALRGPDNEDIELKYISTIYIRSSVLHNLAEKGNADVVQGDHSNVLERIGELTGAFYPEYAHFNHHINHAAKSILSTEGPGPR